MIGKSALWFFGLIAMSFGAGLALVMSAMPYYMRLAGVSVEQVGWYAIGSQLPMVLQFLYAPFIELGLRRKTWFLLLSCLSAVFMSIGLCMPLPTHQIAFLVFILIGQVFSSLIPSCYGGLASTILTEPERDRAASYFNVGILVGAAIGAAVLLQLAQLTSLTTVTTILAGLRIGLAASVLFIAEPVTEGRPLGRIVGEFWHELGKATRSRDLWLGMLLCGLPTCALALNYFIPALAVDYQSPPWILSLTNGAGGWLLTGVGSYIGGLACLRWPRRRVYVVSVLTLALSELLLSSLPVQPLGYLAGVSIYYLTQGAVMTAWSSVVFDLISDATQSAATQYNMFGSATALSTIYMVYLDAQVHGRYGLRALYGFDAVCTILAVFAVVGVLFLLKRSANNKHTAEFLPLTSIKD